jgi:HEAT repeat protein
MVRALAALPSPEACAGLVSLALARRRLLGGGHSTERRVEAVRALATVTAPCRTGALERIACEGDEPVRHAAAAALAGRRSEK